MDHSDFRALRSRPIRLLRNGALDESFPIRAAALGAAPAPDGRLLIGDKLIASDGVTESSPSLGFGYSPGSIKAFAGTRQLWVGGSFDFYHGVPTSRVAKLNLDAVENLAAPKILAAWPERPVFRIGETVTLRAAAIGDGPLTYTWTRGAGVPVETAEPVFRFPASSSAEGGDFVVSVRNSAGSATSLRASFAVEPDELRIAWQPRKVSLMEGRAATLWVQLARTSEARRTEWRKDGQPTDNFFPDVTAAHAGNYTVTFTDVLGNTITSDSIEVTVGDVSRIVNLSTRAQIGAVGPGAILGFVIPPGISPREVLIRGIGPGLVQFGVGGALVRPRLDVFDAHGRALARTNDATDFGVEDAAARAGAFPIAPRDGDTAVVLTLRPGSYTAQLSGIEGAEGLGLIELYETDRLSDRLVNVSSRVLVRDGEAGAAIAGVAIRGAVPKRVLVRVAGPALTAFGVDGVLVAPRLEVRNEAGGIVATNDDWQEFDGRAGAVELNEIAQLPGVTAGVGAFAFPSGSKDAARLVTLEPGNYSVVALVNGAGGGIALVEIYEVPK